MKWRKIIAALLAVGLLAALAACGNDKDAKQAENTQLTVGARISRAELDNIWLSLRFSYDKTTEAEALSALICQKVYAWEADSLGLLPTIEEARQHMQQNYETMRAAAADGNDEQVHGAAETWNFVQEYLEYTGFSEEEYLEMAAQNWQCAEAISILREQVRAELPPTADELEQAYAFGEQLISLVEKYKDCLVEDDLLPLLDEALENI